MHIECEKGSSPLPGTDRSRAPRRPSRRGLPAGLPNSGASSRPKDRSATHGPSDHAGRSSPTEALTLEHVLVAAKRRKAPVSVQTAGYIALGVADALVAAPAIVQPAHVQVTPDGDVLLRGAIGRGDEQAAEHAVRALLARLLSVAVGASPALAFAAHRSSVQGLEAVIEEIEAALVPVNRAAARRTIGRLAREVARAGIRLPEKRSPADSRSAAPCPNRLHKNVKPSQSVPAPPVKPVELESVAPEPAVVHEEDSLSEPATHPRELCFEDPTDVDAPVAPVVRAPMADELAPRAEACVALEGVAQEAAEENIEQGWLPSCDEGGSPPDQPGGTFLEAKAVEGSEAILPEDAFEWEGDIVLHATDPTPPPRLVSRESASRTPQLATYDPRDASAVEETSCSHDDWESEFEQDDDLLTYEPPEALGDESLDFGTASPPDVGLEFVQEQGSDDVVASSEAEALAELAEEVVLWNEEAEASELVGAVAEEVLEASVEQESCATPNDSRPDRVGELLAGFDVPLRSSREVAGELKSMLGLPPTPAPPPGSYELVAQDEQRAASQEPASKPPPAPVQFSPPRNPKLGVGIATGLLVLALAVLIALYVLYPALLVGQ